MSIRLGLNSRFAIASVAIATCALPIVLGRVEAPWFRLVPLFVWLAASWWIIHSASRSMRKREPVPLLAVVVIPLALALTSCVVGFAESLLVYGILGRH
jgi:hypothetical protein